MPFASSTGRRSRWGSGSSSSLKPEEERYNIGQVNRQIENARTRLSDAGVDVDRDTDKRNWFEKATNLPEGQNAFLDALEILGRPGQAVMGGIRALHENKVNGGGIDDALQGARRGFSGQLRTRGSDLARDIGVDNKAAQVALGTALEIGLDPVSYIPGAAFVKGAQVVGKGAGAAGRFAGSTAQKIPGVAKFTENVVRPAAEGTKDALGNMFVRDYKIKNTLDGGQDDFLQTLTRQTENERRYMQENALRNTLDSAKTTGLESGVDVGRIMEAPLRQFEDVKMYEFPDGMRRTTSRRELENEMVANKQQISNLGRDVKEAHKSLDKEISTSAQALEKLDRQITRLYDRAELRNSKRLQRKSPEGTNVQQRASDDAFAEVGGSPGFNLMLQQRDELKASLDNLRELRKTSGASDIANIQKLVQDNEALREVMKNPVAVQREMPRPERELSSDAGVQGAAKKLTQQNEYITKIAAEKGIDIPQLEGYMRHVLSKAEREARKKNRPAPIDGGRRGDGNPNKKIISERQLAGSAEDVNERLGRDFFEPNAYFATAIGQKQLIDYIQAVDLRRKVLSNTNFARPYKKGQPLGKGDVVIDTNNYKFIKDGDEGKGFSGLLDEVGGQYVVTPQVKRVLDRYQKIATDDEGIKSFMRGFDAVNNTWKKLALFSPMYHVRNLAGAMFNNYVGGMSIPAVVKYTNGAVREVTNAVRGKESRVYDTYRRQGLGSESLHNVEFLRSVDPEKQIQKAVERGSKTGGRKALSKLTNAFETSREAGDFVDQVNRFALFKWAIDKGFTPADAAKKVREVQFDYSNLAPFEETATRVIPFYRWMRFNMPFQIERFISDPRKYANVNKIRLNAQDVQGLDEENMPDWMKESFAIPVSGDAVTGTGNVLGLNLPLGDLTRLSDPLKTTMDSIGSILKIGPELALNRNTFYDRPIEQYEGQRTKFDLPGEALDFSLPAKIAYLVEQLGGQPTRMAAGYLKSKDDVDQAQQALQQTLGIATPLKPYNVTANEYYSQRDELQKLLDYIRFIEDQRGVPVRTINEINR